jgi:hypothetical protein
MASRTELEIVRELDRVYNDLSPENLTCDGELGLRATRSKQAILERKLKALLQELGRPMSEEQAYAYMRANARQQKPKLKFVMEIELGTEAMRTELDVADILSKLDHAIWAGACASFNHLTPTSRQMLRDSNGNKVGYWQVRDVV